MPKIYGTYRAVVVDVDDPKQLDRVKVRVPEVLGNTITDWVWPKHPAPHWSWKPVKDENVWVEFEAGDVDRPLYSGTWYPLAGGVSSIPQESQDEYPDHRMIATPDGHKIEFKDQSRDEDGKLIEDSSRYVRITTQSQHILEMVDTKDAEHLMIESIQGHKLTMDDVAGQEKVEVETQNGHRVQLDDANNTVTIEHKDGHKITLAATTVEILHKDGEKISLTASAVEIGQGSVQKIFTEVFQAIYNAHVHVSPAGGSTLAPTVQLTGTELTVDTKAS